MQVLNIHKRTIAQPRNKIAELFATLASRDDQFWPSPQWPRMKLDRGLAEGSKGGHGPIRYTVQKFIPGEFIQFKFTQPKGFEGIHQFELLNSGVNQTELIHTIRMDTTIGGALAWVTAIRWLHDALVEDAFDRIENRFGGVEKKTEWNLWVKILRKMLPSGKRSS